MAARKTTTSKEVTPMQTSPAQLNARVMGAQLQRANDEELRKLQMKQKQLLAQYKAQPKVEVTVSPMYAPYFGNNQPVELNGCKIYIPCDGKAYKIPKSFAREVKSRVRKVDNQIKRMHKIADYRANEEAYIGEKDLISRV